MGKKIQISIIFLLFLTLISLILFIKTKQSTPMTVTLTTPRAKDAEQNYQIVRQPAVAGQFYPADTQELSNMLDNFFNNVKPKKINQPQALIVPHAGYAFSGQTAGYAFKTLENYSYRTIILLGPSHNFPITKLVLYDGDAVNTPLGNIPVDKTLVSKLVDNINIVADNDIHLPEHSIETELPFLQKILGNNFNVVLGLINTDNLDKLESISISLQKNMDKDNLLVISSDLSHYPNYADANYSDNKILAAILTRDISTFDKTITTIMNENIPNLDTCACGSSAIKIAMLIANSLQLEGQILNYANSGDTAYGDKNKVVGYGAVAFTKQKPINNPSQLYLNKEEQAIALLLARQTLESAFNTTSEESTTYQNYSIFSEKRGVFVTLTISQQLRGCIGIIEPISPLGQAIVDMASSAAFDDPRFSPITKKEFEQVKIEISVLTPPLKIENIAAIQLGKHGVIIKRGLKSGVFLPQVAADTNWSKQEFLDHLCEDKAGLPANCWLDRATEIYIFEAQIFSESENNK